MIARLNVRVVWPSKCGKLLELAKENGMHSKNMFDEKLKHPANDYVQSKGMMHNEQKRL